jgi:hypothetical protein
VHTYTSVLVSLALYAGCANADHTAEQIPGLFASADQVFAKSFGVHLVPGEIRLDADIEYGIHHIKDQDKREKLQDLTLSGTVNYGLTSDTEVYLTVPVGWQMHHSIEVDGVSTGSRVGVGDTRLGVRYRLLHETTWLPETTLLASVSFPTGARPTELTLLDHAGWSGGGSVAFIKSYSFAHLIGKVGVGAGGIHGAPFLEYAGGVGFSLQEDLDLGILVDGTVPTRSLGVLMGDRVMARTSLTYLVTPQCAIELSAGKGLTKTSPDYTASLGVSILF